MKTHSPIAPPRRGNPNIMPNAAAIIPTMDRAKSITRSTLWNLESLLYHGLGAEITGLNSFLRINIRPILHISIPLR